MRKKIEEKKWRDILSDISENVTEVSYRSWFAPLVPMEIDEDAAVIYFATSKKQIMEVLEMRYIPVFERAVESVYHKKYKVVVKNKTESEIQQQLDHSDPFRKQPCFRAYFRKTSDQYAEAEGSGFAGRE